MKHQLKKTALLILVLTLMTRCVHSQTMPSSVVKLTEGTTTCTGVLIGNGYVLTAEHCHIQEAEAMFFNGHTVKVKIVYDPPRNHHDEAAILKIEEPGDYPYAILAPGVKKGEAVYSWGYPSGNKAFKSGFITRIEQLEPGGYDMIHTNFFSLPGHSGAPLFNSRGEVVGLASSTKMPFRDTPGSHWISLATINASLKAASLQRYHRKLPDTIKKPILVIFGTDNCLHCKKIKQSKTLMNHEEFEILYVEWGTEEYKEVYDRYKQATGKTISVVPTFWVEGTPQSTTYTQLGIIAGLGAIEAEGVIAWTLKTITQFLFGRIKKRIEKRRGNTPTPPREETPEPYKRPPIIEAEEDWIGVYVIVLIKKHLTGASGAIVGALGNRIANGPIKRKLEAVTKGQAHFRFIFERKRPYRFKVVSEQAGVLPDPFQVIVLVPRRVKGFAKGIIARKIEKGLSGRLKDTPVDVVFERMNSEDYHAIKQAIFISEYDKPSGGSTDREQGVQQTGSRVASTDQSAAWGFMGLASFITGVLSYLIGRWKRSKKDKRDIPMDTVLDTIVPDDSNGRSEFSEVVERLSRKARQDVRTNYRGDEVQTDGTVASQKSDPDCTLMLELYKEAVAEAAVGQGNIKQFGGRIIGQAILDYIDTKYAQIKGVHTQGV